MLGENRYNTWNKTIMEWYQHWQYADTNAPDVNHVQVLQTPHKWAQTHSLKMTMNAANK